MSVNVFLFLSHERVPLLLNTPHTDKIALTNDAKKSEFAHFQIFRTFFFSKIPKTLVYQQNTAKVSNFEQ